MFSVALRQNVKKRIQILKDSAAKEHDQAIFDGIANISTELSEIHTMLSSNNNSFNSNV